MSLKSDQVVYDVIRHFKANRIPEAISSKSSLIILLESLINKLHLIKKVVKLNAN